MGDGLRKKFPHFTIKFLNGTTGGSIETMIATGTHFDLFFSTAGRTEGVAFRNGFAFDMTELLKKHGVNLNDFDPAFHDALGPAYGGRTYFLPYLQESMILISTAPDRAVRPSRRDQPQLRDPAWRGNQSGSIWRLQRVICRLWPRRLFVLNEGDGLAMKVAYKDGRAVGDIPADSVRLRIIYRRAIVYALEMGYHNITTTT